MSVGGAPPSGGKRQAGDSSVDSFDRVEEDVRAGHLDRAIESLRADARRGADASRYLAWLEQRRGEFEASRETSEALTAADSGDFEAQLLAAYAAWFEGDLSAARSGLEQVIQATVGGGELGERARRSLESLEQQKLELVPVAAASRRLDSQFGITIVLLATLAAIAVVRSLRGP